ncbi:MAG: hypothetical protein FWC62_06945, partial [Firmicutes bacterium]|nr:hypothetical protein [Bacillota bacterium]
MKYWIYEVFNKKRPVVIHRADCRYCRDGEGFQDGDQDGVNGQWHGPFSTLPEAVDFAKTELEREIHYCIPCQPDRSESYWLYEVFSKRRPVVIHRADCRYCRDGEGFQDGDQDGVNGRWHGPFPTLQEAVECGRTELGREIHFCIPCHPDKDDAEHEAAESVSAGPVLAEPAPEEPAPEEPAPKEPVPEEPVPEEPVPEEPVPEEPVPEEPAPEEPAPVSEEVVQEEQQAAQLKRDKIALYTRLKATFPDTYMRAGKIVLPGISFKDIKDKCPDVSTDLLLADFSDVSEEIEKLNSSGETESAKAKVKLPEVKADLPKVVLPEVDVQPPSADIQPPEVDVQAPEVDVQTP